MAQNPLFTIRRDPDLEEVSRAESVPQMLPGVKCDACGRTWFKRARSACVLPATTEKVINRVKSPCSVAEFDALKSLLLSVLPEFHICPGLALDRARLRKIVASEFADFLWADGGGGLFVRESHYAELRCLVDPNIGFLRCAEPENNFVEIIPEIIDLRPFGLRCACEVCGYTNIDELNFAAIAESLYLRSDNFLVQPPGMKVAGAGFRNAIARLGLNNIEFQLFAVTGQA